MDEKPLKLLQEYIAVVFKASVDLFWQKPLLFPQTKLGKTYKEVKVKDSYIETVLAHTRNKHDPAKLWKRLNKVLLYVQQADLKKKV